MASSKVEICNRALLVLGARGILSADQQEETARSCELSYEPCLRAILEEGEWNFATGRKQLSRINETPAFEFEYAYSLPNDCLRIQKVYAGDDRRLIESDMYAVEDGKILTNEDHPIYLLYTKYVVDQRVFSEMFTEALVYRMALYMQATIVESDGKQAYLEQAYNNKLRLAKSHDSMVKSNTVGFTSQLSAFKD